MENNNLASERQIEYIKRLASKANVQVNTDNLTQYQASELIKKLSDMQPKEQTPAQNNAPASQEQPKQESNNAVVESHSSALQVVEKNISDKVFNQINVLQNEQGLVLPKGYNVSNALKSAYLTLASGGLLNTDQTALAQALLDMCIQGLTPAKRQCYFIKYENKVQMMRSYFGDRSACINAGVAEEIQANIIYEGDKVDVYYVNDRMKVEHTTNWANFEKPIIGAYAWAILPDGTKIYDIMTMTRIKKSWSMSKNTTNNKLQNNYTDDACKRTVIRHLAKNLFNSSGDNEVISQSYNRTTEDEYDNEKNEYKENSIDAVIEKQEQLNASESFDVVDDETGEVNNNADTNIFGEFIDRK